VVGAWWLCCPGGRRTRLTVLFVTLGLLPVGFAIQLGQPALLVAGALALTAWLLRRGRQVEAGLVLSLAVLKPQLAWLVPPVLLLAGFGRAFLAWAAASVVLLALILVSLGSTGIQQYLDLLRYAEELPVNHYLVVVYAFGPGLQVRLLQALLAVAALVAARLHRAEGPDTVLAIGLLGSAAAGPYLHLADMVMLVLAGWLYLRRPRPVAVWVALAAAAITMEIAYFITPIPFFVAEAACLAALLWPVPARVPAAAETPLPTPAGT
jgi:hypothetical protein